MPAARNTGAGRSSRWRERMRRSVLTGSTGLTVLALLVGVGAGGGAVAFRYMILGVTYLLSGHRDYSAAGHAADPLIPGLGMRFVLVVPVVGGLVYGPLVARFAPEARGHGVPEVMLAVKELGGRMRPQVPIVKSLASAICIGSGGSVGREGRSCRSARRSDRSRDRCCACPRASCGCWSRAAQRVASPRPRADRGCVLRARADPAQLRPPIVRARRPEFRCCGCDRTRCVRLAPVPDAAHVQLQLAARACPVCGPRRARHRRRSRLRESALRRRGHRRPALGQTTGLDAASRRRRAARAAAARRP